MLSSIMYYTELIYKKILNGNCTLCLLEINFRIVNFGFAVIGIIRKYIFKDRSFIYSLVIKIYLGFI